MWNMESGVWNLKAVTDLQVWAGLTFRPVNLWVLVPGSRILTDSDYPIGRGHGLHADRLQRAARDRSAKA